MYYIRAVVSISSHMWPASAEAVYTVRAQHTVQVRISEYDLQWLKPVQARPRLEKMQAQRRRGVVGPVIVSISLEESFKLTLSR